MKNQNSVFLVFVLSLTICLLVAYATFLRHFDSHVVIQAQVTTLQRALKKEKFNNSILAYQLKDMQLSIARALPERARLADNYALKNFEAAVRTPASDEALDLSPALYERAKKNFKSKNYDKAIEEFYKLLNQYPLSLYSIEARFFIAESYFLKKDYRSSIEEIEQMVTQFPHHDLTGFILLRLGQISESNNQVEEASEIYKMVTENFKNEDLRKQAKKMIQNIEIK
jgi:tol-pal system protein YbgF